MRQFIGFFLVLFSVALVLAACSGGAAPADPGNAKPVVIQISSVPDPALVGDVAFTLLITDKDGAPLEGARVDIGVDHTDMTGMSMSGPATEQGDGQYAISANFSMSGNWKMTVYVRKDSLDYKEDFDLKIQ